MDDILERLDKKRAPSSKRVRVAPQADEQQLPQIELQQLDVLGGHAGRTPKEQVDDTNIMFKYTKEF
jgi:hypothetical protein